MTRMQNNRSSIRRSVCLVGPLLMLLTQVALSQEPRRIDTTVVFRPSSNRLINTAPFSPLQHAWGMDLMLSDNGFGLGGFYRRQVSDVISGVLTLAISDVKDDLEMEYIDYYGQSYVPGKVNRLLLIPLFAGVQYRLFKDDIVDNFRPFITAGAGPTMVFVSPYSRITMIPLGNGSVYSQEEKVDFFESLKYGKAHYTLASYVGVGSFFGRERSSVLGLSIRYFFVPIHPGVEVLRGAIAKQLGGIYITLHFGSAS